MLRTFLALDLDETFLRTAAERADELRAAGLSRARWVSPAVLHVTLRFLGDTDETQVPAISELVTALGEAHPSEIDVPETTLLAFPHARRARVLALNLADPGTITETAVAAERGVTQLGFAPESRPFRAHLTIARFREPTDVRRILAAHSSPRPGGSLVALTFYSSQIGKDGPVHTPLATYRLGRKLPT